MKSNDTVNYQSVLRAIGQGLESLEIKSFVLEVSDNNFIVHGECKTPVTTDTSKSRLKKSFLTLVLNVTKKKAVQLRRSRPFRFSGLTFKQMDIELLDRNGKHFQTNS